MTGFLGTHRDPMLEAIPRFGICRYDDVYRRHTPVLSSCYSGSCLLYSVLLVYSRPPPDSYIHFILYCMKLM
ncbi:hypothetical protein GDO81_000221 [Engystomops pustulosus]|uniref:Uncharacterized protein n=1 Tax=Engystomops pustulosus TaxID=76066 RepID=A0AAV7D351_ENGPU|nr:hypothetical protein GDO81_000221 [Engystomops pustulosus]